MPHKPELYRVAHRCLSQLAQIVPEHQVLVVTDSETQAIADIFAAAAATLAQEVMIVRMETRSKHGEEPPPVVAAAMREADVIIQTVKYALTHTEATRQALAKNAQVFVLRGITEEMMLSDLMKVDYAALRQVTEALAEQLSNASTLHVTSPAGTDLTLSIAGRKALALAGGTSPGRFGGARSGEAAIAPVEGSAEGVVVIEHAMDNLGLLDAPIRLEFQNGKLVRIEGGLSATTLQDLLDTSDDKARNLAEFAIGTNPNARLSSNLAESKKIRGSAHIALGDNRSLGGSVASNIHIDGMILKPTVSADHHLLVEQGQLRIADLSQAPTDRPPTLSHS